MFCRPLGRMTSLRFWSKRQPKVMDCRPLGSRTLARLWLKRWPNEIDRSPLGRTTPARLLLKFKPKVMDCRPLGRATPAKLFLNSSPKVMEQRPSGRATSARLLLKRRPNVMDRRQVGKVTSARLLSLNPSANLRLRNVLGSVTLVGCLTPSRLSMQFQTCHQSSPSTSPLSTEWATWRSSSSLTGTTKHWMLDTPGGTWFATGRLPTSV
mmetsp:Transcript_21954/g.69040  ORF Transcript_21954/g.69040 Transcript_21954/m.69040 type:complete len:210 (-) Transcript_21954:332-961(-)